MFLFRFYYLLIGVFCHFLPLSETVVHHAGLVSQIPLSISSNESELSNQASLFCKFFLNLISVFDIVDSANKAKLTLNIYTKDKGNDVEVRAVLKDKSGKVFVDCVVSGKKTKLSKLCAIICDKIYIAASGENNACIFNSNIICISGGSLVKWKIQQGLKVIAKFPYMIYSSVSAVNGFILAVETNAIRGKSFLYVRNSKVYPKKVRKFFFNGSIICARFCPTNPNIIVMNLIRDGVFYIYKFNLINLSIDIITQSRSQEISPSFIPHSNSIAFSSNRHGSLKIMKVDLDNKNVQNLYNVGGTPFGVEFSSSGKFVCIHSGNIVKIYDANDLSNVIWTSEGKFYSIDSVKWASGSDYIVLVSAILKNGCYKLFVLNLLTKKTQFVGLNREAMSIQWRASKR